MHWRSGLFVPGNRPDLIAKTTRHQPGAVIVDLEDSVPVADKEAARAAAAEGVAGLRRDNAEVGVWIRTNPPGTAWFDDDVACALACRVDAVVIPKIESLADHARVAQAVGSGAGRPGVVVGVESARGLVELASLLSGPVIGCYFGAEDFVADLGGVRTDGNGEVAYARAALAVAARAAGVVALDMVVTDFGDTARFEREAAEARAMGYGGKLCIHPRQVALANRAFAPSRDEVDHARRLLAAYDAAVEDGRAAAAFEGRMIDEALARQARQVLAAATADAG